MVRVDVEGIEHSDDLGTGRTHIVVETNQEFEAFVTAKRHPESDLAVLDPGTG